MNSFQGENRKTQYDFLDFRIDSYFHDYKLAKEIDGNCYSDRNMDYETKRQKTIEQNLSWKVTKSDPDKESCDGLKDINGMFRHIKQ